MSHIAVIPAGDVRLDGRQFRLVDHNDAEAAIGVTVPFHCSNHLEVDCSPPASMARKKTEL